MSDEQDKCPADVVELLNVLEMGSGDRGVTEYDLDQWAGCIVRENREWFIRLLRDVLGKRAKR